MRRLKVVGFMQKCKMKGVVISEESFVKKDGLTILIKEVNFLKRS